jgi:hypothetical protein
LEVGQESADHTKFWGLHAYFSFQSAFSLVAQMIQRLPSKGEALSYNSCISKPTNQPQ